MFNFLFHSHSVFKRVQCVIHVCIHVSVGWVWFSCTALHYIAFTTEDSTLIRLNPDSTQPRFDSTPIRLNPDSTQPRFDTIPIHHNQLCWCIEHWPGSLMVTGSSPIPGSSSASSRTVCFGCVALALTSLLSCVCMFVCMWEHTILHL